MMWYAVHVLVPLLFGFLLGSIPFGLLLTRAAGLGDIRSIGSGNIGATNVLRTGNKKVAAAVLIFDGLKGFAPVLIASFFGPIAPAAAALGAVLGHMFTPWLRFKGGKGVATTIGVLWGLYWPLGAITCAAWLVLAFLFRYSSLAALISVALAAACSWFMLDPRAAAVVTLLVPLVWARHHENIRRLLAGTESRIGQKVGVVGSGMGHNNGPSL
jgi:acyl phosphate:glycerol-3-phosphate acyltransferase